VTAGAGATRLATLDLILLPVIASLAACERKTQAKAVDARPVRTIAAQKSDAGETVVLTGQISAENEVSLAFRIGGRIIERSVDGGARPRSLLAAARPAALARLVAVACCRHDARSLSLDALWSLVWPLVIGAAFAALLGRREKHRPRRVVLWLERTDSALRQWPAAGFSLLGLTIVLGVAMLLPLR